MRLSATLKTGKPHGASSYVSGSESASSRIVLHMRRRVSAKPKTITRLQLVSKWPWVPSEERREPLRQTFESAADLYDAARPEYPPQLFEDVLELAELEPGARLLEIGCATGKATRPFLERGFAVTCVELGTELAERARRNLTGLPVTIHVAPFEDWHGEPASFDLVFAATAWHWIDPQVRYESAHHL